MTLYVESEPACCMYDVHGLAVATLFHAPFDLEYDVTSLAVSRHSSLPSSVGSRPTRFRNANRIERSTHDDDELMSRREEQIRSDHKLQEAPFFDSLPTNLLPWCWLNWEESSERAFESSIRPRAKSTKNSSTRCFQKCLVR